MGASLSIFCFPILLFLSVLYFLSLLVVFRETSSAFPIKSIDERDALKISLSSLARLLLSYNSLHLYFSMFPFGSSTRKRKRNVHTLSFNVRSKVSCVQVARRFQGGLNRC